MAKLIILSIVLVSFIIPLLSSTSTNPKRALKRVQQFIFLYVFLWAYLCLHWYPSLVPLK